MSEVKYPEYIFSVTRDYVERILTLSQGLNTHVTHDQFLDQMPGHLVMARREETEKNESLVQLLPYLTFVKLTTVRGVKQTLFFTYQRTKLTGEGRLAGKFSIGPGGHVESRDIGRNGAVEPQSILFRNMLREMQEEVRFTRNGVEVTPFVAGDKVPEMGDCPICVLEPEFNGLIYDRDDTSTKRVGYFHLGISYYVVVPEDMELEVREKDNITIGFRTRGELKELDLENWTRILVHNEVSETSTGAAPAEPVLHHSV